MVRDVCPVELEVRLGSARVGLDTVVPSADAFSVAGHTWVRKLHPPPPIGGRRQVDPGQILVGDDADRR
ncbi:hypothetical protein ABZW47_13020 [Streptomyces sp. NPDC004549]|uniref:hypothetical protein n=1 Tax=Streptomyces sp. NPDC004549 TaxID=3154283 RepID=UPI0033BA7F99